MNPLLSADDSGFFMSKCSWKLVIELKGITHCF